MGCDIHTMAEIKVPDYKGTQNEQGEYPRKWRAITEPVFPYVYFNPEEPASVRNVPYTVQPYQGRNYDLFAILANVRNGYGFAGTPTGDALQPIDEPRGVPEDASKRWKRYVKAWGDDLHSVSYFTLAELKTALPLFHQHQRKTGVITVEQYEKLKRDGGTPQSWSSDVGGGGALVVTPDEYEAGRRAEGDPTEFVLDPEYDVNGWFSSAYKTHIRYVWETTATEATSGFVEETIPLLEANAERIGRISFQQRQEILAANGGKFVDPRPIDEESVRLVFGFDN